MQHTHTTNRNQHPAIRFAIQMIAVKSNSSSGMSCPRMQAVHISWLMVITLIVISLRIVHPMTTEQLPPSDG